MSNYKFSNRMKALASFVLPGETAADIGTDHGFVPIYLLCTNTSPFVVLSDLREGPLDKARGNLARFQLDSKKYSLRLGSGIEPIEKGEVDCIIIAGMGGENIIDILSVDLEKSRSYKRLILQPRKDSGQLRRWLYENKFMLTNEKLVEEDGNICEILVAEPWKSEIPKEMWDDLYLPVKMREDPLFQAFLAQYIRKLLVVVENIEKKEDALLLAPWKMRLEEAEALRKEQT